MRNNKKKKKISLRKWLKGFTLVELLAVIVILAIIMIIAIPNVLNVMEQARKKSFIEFAQKCINEAEKTYMTQTTMGSLLRPAELTNYVYDIRKDIGLSSTGDYYGTVSILLLNKGDNNIGIAKRITLFDKNYYMDYDEDSAKGPLDVSVIVSRSEIEKQLGSSTIKLEDLDQKLLLAGGALNDICNYWDTAVIDAATNTQYFCTSPSHSDYYEEKEDGKKDCKYRTSTYKYEQTVALFTKYAQGKELVTCPLS